MNAIVVVDQEWNIGNQGKLLTHLPEDLKFFKEKTLGKVIVMGRETFESLPGGKPLPDRTTIILSRSGNIKGDTATCIILNSQEAFFEKQKEYNSDDIFIAGGSTVYEQMLPYCDTAYVTKIDRTFIADRRFIDLDACDDWVLDYESEEKEHKDLTFRFTTYIKKIEV